MGDADIVETQQSLIHELAEGFAHTKREIDRALDSASPVTMLGTLKTLSRTTEHYHRIARGWSEKRAV